MADRVGQHLGNYRLIRLLGRGGFAEVYLGEHLRLGTQAAVKVLHTRLASHNDVEGFEREALTIAHLKHPHIVRVLDYDVEEDTPFLVMDYAPGGSLRHRHPKGTRLPLTTIISYVKQVADALQYAHDQRVIHRDIKPENMLVGEQDELLLSDFGIAIAAQSSLYQSTQQMGGTMAYIAPEQIQGHPRPASDQYSLGVVVYEWLSGSCPFHGSMIEIMAQHLTASAPLLQEKVSSISPVVDQVVLTSLAKDPKQRFASVQIFATALERAGLSMQSSLASPVVTSLPSQLPQPIVSAPLSEKLLSLTDMDTAIQQNRSPQAEDRVTPSSQPLEAGNLATLASQTSRFIDTVAPFSATTTSTPSVRGPVQSHRPQQSLFPSQRRISRRAVVAGMTGLGVAGGGLTWLVLSRKPQLSSSTSRPTVTSSPTSPPTVAPLGTMLYIYHGHSNAVRAIAWSPDSKRIASASADGTVQVWDTFDGGHVYAYHGQYDASAVAWSPNGKRIASGGADGTVQVWDAIDGANVYIYQQHANVRAVAWSPNGKRIASGDIIQDTIQVWDAMNGANVYTYHAGSSWVYTVAWSPDSKRIASGGFALGSATTVQVWDAMDGGNIYTYHGHSDAVYTVAWSPDGRRIASASGDSTVQVWNAVDGANVYTYRGHSATVGAAAWSPDGRRIASASADGTVQVWDAADGGNVYTYRGHFNAGPEHSNAVETVAWSPDGGRIASAGYDTTVQVWQAS